MKLIDLFKIQKIKKSKNRVSKTDPLQQMPLDGDGYMSGAGDSVNGTTKSKNDGNSDQP